MAASVFPIVLLPAVVCLWAASASSAAARQTIANETGIELSVDDDGTYRVISRTLDWTFAGKVAQPLLSLTTKSGSDRAGRYGEIEFGARSSAGAGSAPSASTAIAPSWCSAGHS